jgi:hypothetical protein
MSKETIAVLINDIDQHPASLAWKQIDGGQHIPQVIEILQQRDKSAVYRLRERTPGGWAIIAKHCLNETGLLERVVYEEILPFLPVSALHCYGCLENTRSDMWIFLEDAGNRRFSAADESQRILAANWLGALHRSGQQTRAAEILPERGPAYYFELMRRGRENIVQGLANPVVTPEYVGLLRKILVQMDALESNWEQLLMNCQNIPQTLIHGDFRPKNIRIQQSMTGNQLYAIDWEMAGWGIPTVDLAISRGLPPSAQVDLPIYLSIVREFWEAVDIPTLQFFIYFGYLFRRLTAIYWASLGLSYRWIEQPIQSMDILQNELAQVMTLVFGKELLNG